MKKRTLLVALLGLCCLASAQNPPVGIENFGWWDSEYPTITWGRGIRTSDIKAVQYILQLTGVQPAGSPQYYEWQWSDANLPYGSRLESVDGQSAQGMRAATARAMLAERGDHQVGYTRTDGVKRIANLTAAELPIWMQAVGFNPMYCSWNSKRREIPDNIVIRTDKDVNWHNFKTYDYLILSEDVLADRELMEIIGDNFRRMGMTRDEVNPDILITLTKDANKSVEYTYVPEQVQHVQTGSSSTPIYGWKGAYLGSITTNDYKTVKTGGYTQKTSTTDAYLEVSILEAARMGQRTLPMIWQMKYNYHNNTDSNVDALYRKAVDYVRHPLDSKALEYYESATPNNKKFYENYSLLNFGIVTDMQNIVRGVDQRSDVVRESGLQKGDKIVSVKCTEKRHISRGRDFYGTITVERNGSTRTLKFKNCRPTNSHSLTFSKFFYIL